MNEMMGMALFYNRREVIAKLAVPILVQFDLLSENFHDKLHPD